MGVDELLATLLRDAGAEADRRRAAAVGEAALLVGTAQARLAAERERTCREREVALRAAATAEVDAMRVEHGRRVLEARERLLDRVRTAAEPAARTLFEGDAGSLEAVRALVRQVGDVLPPGEVVLRSAPEWVPLLARVTEGDGGALRVEGDPTVRSGFLAVATTSGVVADQRLATRLAQQWPDLAIALVRAVDGSGETGPGVPAP